MTGGRFEPLRGDVGSEIRQDHACAPRCREVGGEALEPVLQASGCSTTSRRRARQRRRKPRTAVKTSETCVPAWSACSAACWTVGPSITGSEYGRPTSTISTPASTIAAIARHDDVNRGVAHGQVADQCRASPRSARHPRLAVTALMNRPPSNAEGTVRLARRPCRRVRKGSPGSWRPGRARDQA